MCQGDDCGTLYSIVGIVDNKCWAKSIFIDKHNLQALECTNEYDIEIPNDVVMLPSNSYEAIKVLMLDCVDDIHKTLCNEAIDVDFKLEADACYTDGVYIYRLGEIKEGSWHYNLFRIEEENILTNWSGSVCVNNINDV